MTMTTRNPAYVVLHDDDLTTRIVREQHLARLELTCWICGAHVATPSELDASGRCDDCRP